MENVLEDRRINEILSMLADGKTKEEIASHYNHKSWKTLDMYFRRRGFKWDGNTYFLPSPVTPTAEEDSLFTQTKAAQITRQLGQRYANIEEIALKHGFSTIDELGDYMKSHGYMWNTEQNTYTYDERLKKTVSTEQSERIAFPIATTDADYGGLLAFLTKHQEKLMQLLETQTDATLPRYKFKGAKANKTLGLPTSVQVLLNDYSKEFNVTQRDIVEVALADFFRRYGYEEQLNQIILM
ncbi:hypothetical protein [Sporosarcina sp. JAI121]|uniref:hypothetical protein n=1 Tax=Sporosarcina sp. JAI121 TaxID=2723064 RepID=UPI0015CCE7DA|nr:hypothetical protein [Sporosarcina sp. JAI121]NYF23571.1 hypothetical protein [Sporosarcina sp. JAI121]